MASSSSLVSLWAGCTLSAVPPVGTDPRTGFFVRYTPYFFNLAGCCKLSYALGGHLSEVLVLTGSTPALCRRPFWRFEWLFCGLVVAAVAVANEEYDVVLPSVGDVSHCDVRRCGFDLLRF